MRPICQSSPTVWFRLNLSFSVYGRIRSNGYRESVAFRTHVKEVVKRFVRYEHCRRWWRRAPFTPTTRALREAYQATRAERFGW